MTALTLGGGISFRQGDVISLGALSLTNCTLSGNTGGGIISTGELTLTHCMFSSNTGDQGGGIRSSNTATLTNCTFFANFGQSGGGGIYRQLEVYRDPIADESQEFGNRYKTLMILKPGESVTALVLPGVALEVSELLH